MVEVNTMSKNQILPTILVVWLKNFHFTINEIISIVNTTLNEKLKMTYRIRIIEPPVHVLRKKNFDKITVTVINIIRKITTPTL